MEVLTDFPERLIPGAKIFTGDKLAPRNITASRKHARGLIIRLEGFNSPEEAGQLRNQPVFVTTADRPQLPKGTYYHHQLLGCTVIDGQRGPIGTLSEILQTGANDVYIVRQEDGAEMLLPAIPRVVLDISIEERVIKVQVPDGIDFEARR